MLEADKPKRGFSWGLVAVSGIGVLAIGAVAVFAVWYLFLRQSPYVQNPPGPGPKKPGPSANQTSPDKPPVPKPPANVPVVTPPANTAAPPKEPANTVQPVVTPPANATTPPKEPANTTVTPPKEPEPPAPAGDARDLLDQGRYAEAARAFQDEMRSKRGGFTINVEVACQPDTLAKGLAAAGGHRDFMILPYNLKGRSCYRVIWGHYPDKASAEEAMRDLPAFFKAGASPQVAPWK
jgi:septal ring-binding cell division protein DamX